MNFQAFLRQWLKDMKPKGSLHLGIDGDPYIFFNFFLTLRCSAKQSLEGPMAAHRGASRLTLRVSASA